jgi:hypothetical protein
VRSGVAALISLALAGCTAAGGLLGGDATPQSQESPPGAAGGSNLDTRGLGVYLETMRALVEGDRVLQAEVFEDAAIAAELSPTTTNRLRLALALAIPGHAAADPSRARGLLSELLAAGDTLLPEERTLAAIHLQEVEQRLILDTASQQRQMQSEEALSRQNAESAQRLEAMQQENQRLREALSAAEEKLEAITNIERSIRARDSADDVP